MLTYQPIIAFLENGGAFTYSDAYESLHPLLQQLQQDCKEKFGAENVCVLGAYDLQVATVGDPVRIHEYNGSESLEA